MEHTLYYERSDITHTGLESSTSQLDIHRHSNSVINMQNEQRNNFRTETLKTLWSLINTHADNLVCTRERVVFVRGGRVQAQSSSSLRERTPHSALSYPKVLPQGRRGTGSGANDSEDKQTRRCWVNPAPWSRCECGYRLPLDDRPSLSLDKARHDWSQLELGEHHEVYIGVSGRPELVSVLITRLPNCGQGWNRTSTSPRSYTNTLGC